MEHSNATRDVHEDFDGLVLSVQPMPSDCDIIHLAAELQELSSENVYEGPVLSYPDSS